MRQRPAWSWRAHNTVSAIIYACIQMIRKSLLRLKGKKSYPCNRPWRLMGVWDVENPAFSRRSVVSLTRRPLFNPQEDKVATLIIWVMNYEPLTGYDSSFFSEDLVLSVKWLIWVFCFLLQVSSQPVILGRYSHCSNSDWWVPVWSGLKYLVWLSGAVTALCCDAHSSDLSVRCPVIKCSAVSAE